MNVTTDSWFVGWVGAARFEPYLRAAGHDVHRARALYDWNARLAAAFLHDLSHLEIGLRNAYDRALQAAVVPGDSHWTDPATLEQLFPEQRRRGSPTRGRDVNAITRSKVEAAVARSRPVGDGRPLPGKVVAELSFGFWTFLSSDRLEKTIWLPFLRDVHGSGVDRDHVRSALEHLREFRNRAAHHESIHRRAELHRRLLIGQVRRLSSDAAVDLHRRSDVVRLLQERP